MSPAASLLEAAPTREAKPPHAVPRPAERLLGAVVAAARSLLAHDELYAGLHAAMQPLGEASGHDRAYVFEMRAAGRISELVAEWNAPGIASIRSLWGTTSFAADAHEEVIAPLRRGAVYRGQPERRTGENAELNAVVGNVSDLMVPIFVAGQFWGMVGLDHCRAPYDYDDAEVDALRGAAEAIAAAVQRGRARAAQAASEAARVAQAEADHRALRRREELLAAVNEATRRLVQPGALDDAVGGAIEALRQATGVDRVFVNRYVAAEQATYPWLESHAAGLPSLADGFGPGPWPDEAFPEVALPLREGRTYRSLAHERRGANARANEIARSRSDLIVPILVDGRYRACIGFDDVGGLRDWTDGEVAVLDTAAHAIAGAIARDDRERAARTAAAARADEAEALNRLLEGVVEASRVLNEYESFDSGLASWLETIARPVAADAAYYGGFGADGWPNLQIFWRSPSHALKPEQFAAIPIPDTSDFRAWLAALHAGQVVHATLDELRDPASRAYWLATDCAATAIAPIRRQGRTVGWIGFDSARTLRWDDTGLAVLRTAADVLCAALQREEARRAALAERERRLDAEHERAEAAQALNRLLEGVVEASRVLHEFDDFDVALDRWLGVIATAVGAQAAYIGTLDGARPARVTGGWLADSCPLTKEAYYAVNIADSEDTRRWAAQVADGEVVQARAEDLRDPKTLATWQAIGCAAILIAPIRRDTTTIGWIALDGPVSRRWDEASLAVLRTAADVLCAALQREDARRSALAERERRVDAERARAEAAARHAERLGRHATLLAAVACAADELLGTDDLLTSIDAALRHVGPVAQAQRACLALLALTPDDPATLGWQHIRAEWTAGDAARQIDGPLARFAMRRDDPTWAQMFDALRRDGRLLARCDDWDEPARSEQRSLGVEWTVAHPIEVGGTLRALLGFDFGTPIDWFDEADHAALKTLASVIANAMARVESEQRAIDAERQRADDNERLAGLLGHVVQSSRALIDAEPQAFEPALRRWLEGLAERADAQRATFYDAVPFEPGGVRTARMLCEWAREGLAGSIPVSFDAPYTIDPRGAERLMAQMLGGRVATFHAGEVGSPMREFLAAQGNATVISVPVLIGGAPTYWLSFDFAQRREADPTEVMVLTTAADTLAAVLRRNEIARALLAEREARLQAQIERTHELGQVNDALRRAAGGIAQQADLNGFLREVLRSAMQLIDAHSGAVAVFDGTTAQHLVLHDRQGWVAEQTMAALGLQTVRLDDAVSQAFLALMPTSDRHWITSPDAGWMPEAFRRFHERQGTQALCLVPLVVGERLAGWMGLGFASSRPPTEDRASILRVMADQINVALEFDRVARAARQAAIALEREHAAEQRAAELARANLALRRSVARLADSRDLQSFLVQLVDEVRRMLGAGVAQVFLYDAATHTLRASVGVGEAGTGLAAPGVLPSEGFTRPFDADVTPAWRRMLEAGAPVSFDLERNAGDFWPGTVEYHRRQGHRRSLCTAMRLGDIAIGVLGVANHRPEPYTTTEHELLQVFAQQAALAIQTDRYAEEARAAAVAREREIAQRTRLAELARANHALRNATLSLTPGAPIEDFLTAVLLECTAVGGARSAGAFVFDEAAGELRMVAFVSDGKPVDIASDPRMAQWRRPVPQPIAAAWMAALAGAEQLAFDNRMPPDAHPWPVSRAWHEAFGHTDVIDVPLHAGGRLVGLLGQCFCSETTAARFDLAHTQALAHLAALAVYQQRLAEAARIASVERERQHAEHARLLELSRANDALRVSIDALAETTDEEAFLRRSLHQIAVHAGALAVWLFRTTGDGALVRLVGSSRDGRFSADGEPGDPPLFRTARLVNPTAALRMRAHGRLLWRSLAEPVDPAEYQPEIIDWHRRSGHRANALHGLMIGSRQVGMVGMVFGHDRRPSDSQQELIHGLCQPLALALELMRLGRDSRRSAERAAMLAERNRLAREIHDGIAQSFLAIQMQLGTLAAEPAPPPVAKALELARHGLTEARRAVTALRPQSLLGRSLPEAVAAAIAQWTGGSGLHVQVAQPPSWQALPGETEDHLFRIVQEAVHNVVKHARARSLRIELNQLLEATSVLVADDGVGFDPRRPADGFGLEGMRQRAGLIGAQLQWQSAPDLGTQVLVSLSAVPGGDHDGAR